MIWFCKWQTLNQNRALVSIWCSRKSMSSQAKPKPASARRIQFIKFSSSFQQKALFYFVFFIRSTSRDVPNLLSVTRIKSTVFCLFTVWRVRRRKILNLFSMLEWLQSDVTNYKGRIVSENFSVYKSDLKKIEVISALDDKFAIAKTQKIALGLEKSNVEVIGLDCEWARIFNSAAVFKIMYDFTIVKLLSIYRQQNIIL